MRFHHLQPSSLLSLNLDKKATVERRAEEDAREREEAVEIELHRFGHTSKKGFPQEEEERGNRQVASPHFFHCQQKKNRSNGITAISELYWC